MSLAAILKKSTEQRAELRLCRPDELPCQPNGDRVLLLPYPVGDETVGGLYRPRTSLEYRNGGWILAGGLQAMNKMHDQGFEIGDEVIFGKYSSVYEGWDRLLEEAPDCEHNWHRRTDEPTREGVDMYRCAKCGVRRDVGQVWIINFDDILANISLRQRLERGEVYINRGALADGRTCHKYEPTPIENCPL